jgi:tetratricopeptide (TPR) repeat protein
MLAMGVVLAAMWMVAPMTTVVAEAQTLGFPMPTRGPGAPTVSRSDQRKIERAWTQLAEGKIAAARKRASRVKDPVVGHLLRDQITMVEGIDDARAALESLVTDNPEYAAAWLTLSVAGERSGDEARAWEAANRGLELWPVEEWQLRVDELRARWIDDRVSNAALELVAGDAEAALQTADLALALDPDQRDGLLVTARALVALEEVELAEVTLAALGSDPDALYLAGRIAEERADWQTAMDLYGSLPEVYPDRDAALLRAQLRWRRANFPSHVQEALASPDLTRAELAVVLVSSTPELEGLVGGTVPVLSDIIELPSHREILTAVRLELFEVDPFEHRFAPQRIATREEVHSAVEGLCHLLGLSTPVWCAPDDVVSSSCTTLADPVSGEETAALVMSLVQGEPP